MLIGLLMGTMEERFLTSPQLRMFLTIGVLGGFTTFSTFSYETIAMLRSGDSRSYHRETLLTGAHMKLSGEGKLLRIFIGESDKVEHQPLFEVIVREAKKQGLAGATVLRGVEGFGANSRIIHTAKILRLSEDLPIVVEIVDEEQKVTAFLQHVDRLFEQAKCGGMITVEKVEIIRYSAGKS
jgi:PII-like signaling protein